MSTAKSDIRNKYKGMSLYTQKEYDDIWQDAIIVLDTNTLLNFYRYSNDTRKNVLKVLKVFKDRIWIPQQVLKEYFRNRDEVIDDSSTNIESLEAFIKDKFDKIEENIKTNSKKIESIEKIEENLKKEEESLNSIFADIKSSIKSGDIQEKNLKIEAEIFGLISNSYEEEYEYKDIEDVIKEGDRRIKDKIPPGYKDSKKQEQYKDFQVNGDYIIFNSVINIACKKDKNVIIITDDKKEDWFQEVNGKNIGGRNELLQEFYQRTGRLLLIYTPEGFINKYNAQNPEGSVPEETVKELENINNNEDRNTYFHYLKNYINRELSDGEKRKCLKEIYVTVSELLEVMKNNTHDNNNLNKLAEEILLNIYKIDNYRISDRNKDFEKIHILTMYSIRRVRHNDYKAFYNNINSILNELDDVINSKEIIIYG